MAHKIKPEEETGEKKKKKEDDELRIHVEPTTLTTKNIIIEKITVNYCFQCKAPFPTRIPTKEHGYDNKRESTIEDEAENCDDFCSKFCKDQSKTRRGREKDPKRKEPETAASGARDASGSITDSQVLLVNSSSQLSFSSPTTVSRLSSSSTSSSGTQDESVSERDVDGGYACIILAVMFIINASTYGTARAYGLIFEKIAREYNQSRTLAALPFNVMGALENLGGPIVGYLLAKTSWRVTVFTGSSLVTLAHLLASFSESIINRILTMGLMCGIGLSLISISAFNINNAYFNRYRSRAFGFCLTGAAFGTFYISPSCEYVLEEYSVSHCYLLLAFILFPNVPLSLLLKPKKKSNQLIRNDTEIMTSCTIEPVMKEQQQQQLSSKEDLEQEQDNSTLAAPATEHQATMTLDRKEVGSSNVINEDQHNKCNNVKEQRETTKVYIITKNERQKFDREARERRLQMRRSSKNNNMKDLDRRKEKKLKEGESLSLTKSVKLVISTPMFHLIWLTQLLFCWFNFVFGMIIVDFGKDRGLDDDEATDLVLIWAFGQLFGRLGLGSLVDIKLISYRTFTILCFLIISLTTWSMNNVQLNDFSIVYQNYFIFSMVFILSMFIAVLYILFNGLTVEYMDKSLSSFTVGISSFIGSFFLFPRANVIGHYRDTLGNYDAMLTLFQFISLGGAITWLIVPFIIERIRYFYLKRLEASLSISSNKTSTSNEIPKNNNSNVPIIITTTE